MALPPICHCESRSKMSAPGHIVIGTWTRIGCNGCPSHVPFKKLSNHFMTRNEKCPHQMFAARYERARVKFQLWRDDLCVVQILRRTRRSASLQNKLNRQAERLPYNCERA